MNVILSILRTPIPQHLTHSMELRNRTVGCEEKVSRQHLNASAGVLVCSLRAVHTIARYDTCILWWESNLNALFMDGRGFSSLAETRDHPVSGYLGLGKNVINAL